MNIINPGFNSDIQMSAYLTNAAGTFTIVKSFNVSSLTDRGEGIFTAIPTNNLPSANYVLSGTAGIFRKLSDDTNLVRSVSAVPLMVSYATTLADINFSFQITQA